MFRPGQKVICLDDQFPSEFFLRGKYLPCAGEIYTVRHVEDDGEEPMLRLQEIVNPHRRFARGLEPEVSFRAGRFRAYDPASDEVEEEVSQLLR